MFLWAGNFIVVKGAIAALPPVAFAFVRFAISAATLLVVLYWREGGIGLPRRDVLSLAVLGAVGFGLYQIPWATALQTVSAGDSALLIAATPVFTALLAVGAGSDVLTPGSLAGALVSLAGVAVVIGGGTGLSLGASLVGDLVTLAAASCWAIYTAFGAPILRRHSPLRTATWAIVFEPCASSRSGPSSSRRPTGRSSACRSGQPSSTPPSCRPGSRTWSCSTP
jgi:drug/metabolite transporter (DMT)-like permease